MFKRVGATILTIVMLLSMASVVSSAETAPMSLAVEVVDSAGNPLSTIAPGDEVNAIVKIKNPVALSGMAVGGSYDADLFVPNGEPEVYNVDTDGSVLMGQIDRSENDILAAWVADANVTATDGATLISVPLVVKEEAVLGAADITFYFLTEEMLIEKDGGTAALPAEEYSAAHVPASVTIAKATSLEVVVPANAKVGRTTKVKVNVKDYAGNWSAMTILGSYDTNKLELQEVTPILGNNGPNQEPAVEKEPGKVAVTWFDDEVLNKGTEFTALELTFLVKEEGTATVEFSFDPEGIKDANGEKVSADAFIAEKASDTVTLEPADPVVPNQTTLDVSVSADRAKIGEQVTFTVNVQDYLDNWLAMAIFAKYDQSKLKYIGTTSSITGFNQFEVNPETDEPGTVKGAWINDAPVVLGKNFKAMEMVFEVIAEGDTAVSFEFKPGGIITTDPSGNEIHAPEESYSKEPVSKPISLISVPFVEIAGDSTANLNEEYTVELKLKGYNNNWSSFGVELTYDSTKFTIIDDVADIVANAFGGNAPVVDSSVDGKIRLIWSGSANIDAEIETTILRVTFKAIGTGDNVDFDVNLFDVKTFDGNENVDVDEDEYKPTDESHNVTIEGKSVPYLSLAVEPDNAFDEGTDGVLKLYLNDYHGDWSTIPVVLNFDSNLIRIKEGDIVCNPLGEVDGVVAVRGADGKIVFTWMSVSNIEVSGSKIELASIPFRAYRNGEAIFGGEFVADSIKTSNGQGSFNKVDSDTYVLKAENQTVNIEDKYSNTDPVFLSIGTASVATKNKKQPLTLSINNLSSRVQALSVKLFYDKNEVSISKEDIDAFENSANGVVGEATVNQEEGYVHLTVIAPESISDEETLTLLNLLYTPKVVGKIDFYAEIELLGDTDENPMDPLWDYLVRSETVEVEVESSPSLSATANNKNVKIGDTVFVTVSVNDYKNLWSAMTNLPII